jgi:phenylacetate-CoA ligase
VLIAFNYNLFIGFWQCHYGCEKIGAEIIPGGSLPTEVKLQKIQELSITVVATTPSYAFRMAEVAEQLGIDLKNSSVRKLITSGEPGGLVSGVKDKLQKAWGADVYDNIGATEVGSWGFECTEKSGGMHINESYYLPEIIGIEDEEPITEPGKCGRLVLTSFFRGARPCIRFNTNDIAMWADAPCSCGRTYRMIAGGIQGRVDHILKVRGTFVNPVAIEDVINKYEKCSQEYQITIHEDNVHITVTAEAASGIEEPEFSAIAKEVSRRIHHATFVKMDVVIVPYGSMARSDAKSKRVVDLRKEKKIWTAQK